MFLQGAKALNKIYLCSNSHQSSKFHFLNMQSNKYKLGLINIQMPANTDYTFQSFGMESSARAVTKSSVLFEFNLPDVSQRAF